MSWDEDRVEIVSLHKSKEQLRLEHNSVGADFRSGKITWGEWQQYLHDEFLPASEQILGRIGKIEDRFREERGFPPQKLSDKTIVYPTPDMSDGEQLHYLLYLGQCLENTDSLREEELHLRVSKATKDLRRRLKNGR